MQGKIREGKNYKKKKTHLYIYEQYKMEDHRFTHKKCNVNLQLTDVI